MTQKIFFIFIVIYCIWNLIVFALMGIDKQKAIAGRRRISEKTLLTGAFVFGGVGGLFGMFAFRHKTRHTKFRVLLPLFSLINLSAIYLIWQNLSF